MPTLAPDVLPLLPRAPPPSDVRELRLIPPPPSLAVMGPPTMGASCSGGPPGRELTGEPNRVRDSVSSISTADESRRGKGEKWELKPGYERMAGRGTGSMQRVVGAAGVFSCNPSPPRLHRPVGRYTTLNTLSPGSASSLNPQVSRHPTSSPSSGSAPRVTPLTRKHTPASSVEGCREGAICATNAQRRCKATTSSGAAPSVRKPPGPPSSSLHEGVRR
ncbi:hypothetical protein Vafri_15334 [Volvox africanus]|uniref:Uncharacterized protein n=1 Tax=Volvox africanus TaxID=51714 RepID=A0A8J4BF73_9CHLO|nr:hypothetical protein Vafri_15334 [Volvox africanus]